MRYPHLHHVLTFTTHDPSRSKEVDQTGAQAPVTFICVSDEKKTDRIKLPAATMTSPFKFLRILAWNFSATPGAHECSHDQLLQYWSYFWNLIHVHMGSRRSKLSEIFLVSFFIGNFASKTC
jgi:hypothetical protein